MPNFEHHTIIGHVGGEVTLRYTSGAESGIPVASFSLAVNDRFKKDAPPTWYRVTCWRQLAEFVNEYVKKGAPLMVAGERLALSEWTAENGDKRTTLELTARDVVLLGRKGEVDAEHGGGDDQFPF